MKKFFSTRYYILLAILCIITLSACQKYLDVKSNQKLTVPASLQDAQALLDNYTLNNTFLPAMANVASDDYYVSDVYYNGTSIANRNDYVWSQKALMEYEWASMYALILRCNIARETAEKITITANNASDWNRVVGASYFLRAYALFQVAEFYAEPYNKVTAANKPGISLRLSSNPNEISTRATLEASWQQIVSDYKKAIQLLPLLNAPVSRPNKPAAYGALARTYLMMGDYANASICADSALKLNGSIIDYNTLDPNAAYPFTRFNNTGELFHSLTSGTGMLSATNAKIDSLLYMSYSDNDLRKTVLFRSSGSNTYSFKGNYEGTAASLSNGAYFNGIATDEILLIRAECNARLGNKDLAMSDLNSLLIKRWKSGAFSPLTATNATDALSQILIERRKELVFRGLRWFDLRRLNIEPTFSKTIYRNIANQVYSLPPGDSRYTFTIPIQVISITGMEQNAR